jgi:hypothetical protein
MNGKPGTQVIGGGGSKGSPSLRACKLKQATLMEGVMRSLRLSAMCALGISRHS